MPVVDAAAHAERLRVIARVLDDAVALHREVRAGSLEAVASAAEVIATAYAQGGKVLAFGNGGSAADAQHFAAELVGRFERDRRGMAALALSTDTCVLTSVANDYGFERVFARGVEAWGTKGDALVVFSTSGNSANVIAAVDTARARGLYTIGLLGRDGGLLAGRCDASIVVPGITSDRIQEIHIKIVHLLIEQIEFRLFNQQ